jgi:hypothetical protein
MVIEWLTLRSVIVLKEGRLNASQVESSRIDLPGRRKWQKNEEKILRNTALLIYVDNCSAQRADEQ